MLVLRLLFSVRRGADPPGPERANYRSLYRCVVVFLLRKKAGRQPALQNIGYTGGFVSRPTALLNKNAGIKKGLTLQQGLFY